jgi:glycosyltransferase involved in cell wall biosynthesis
LLRLEHRRGPGGARNAGARLAHGELVGFLDSDDVWLPGKLDAELAVLAQFPEAEVVVSDSQNFFEGEADGESRFRAEWFVGCDWWRGANGARLPLVMDQQHEHGPYVLDHYATCSVVEIRRSFVC